MVADSNGLLPSNSAADSAAEAKQKITASAIRRVFVFMAPSPAAWKLLNRVPAAGHTCAHRAVESGQLLRHLLLA
jgi:hypothetical protein